jgi:DNA-binding GntR family transcriptional regulator
VKSLVDLHGVLEEQDALELPLAERAYRDLQRQIITLQMKPGDVISESELQRTFGMGRTPIREALIRLSADRLVRIHPRRGTFVSDMHITDLGAVYEVRAPLEALAAQLAAERITDEECEQLAVTRRQLQTFVENAGHDEHLLTADGLLHRIVYQLARNDFLQETLEHYLNLSIRLSRASLERSAEPWPDWLIDSLLEFIPLFQAIEERRPDDAILAAQAHAASAAEHVRMKV